MKRQDAERITTEYLKPVYGFALKRCCHLQDAEDLSQEIIIKAYRTLLTRDDIEDVGKFIWTIAHNALSNYYRDNGRSLIGASLDELEEISCADGGDLVRDVIAKETAEKLQGEIAYLSKLQRRIVIAYYYENKKQSDIAAELGIPAGTVKWHLFEAKKDLKRGLKTMRTSSELKFNPIRFALCGTNGSPGSMGHNGNFFRSVLAQNIAYAVWKEPRTIQQIADALGVSPVYVESEVEFLEKYGFLTKQGDKYLCHILIEEATDELNRMQDDMYDKAAAIFANALYDALMKADIWDNPGLTGGCTGDLSFQEDPPKDKNFFLWALIPYITARSGRKLIKPAVSFNEAATLRPDGGHNICLAIILNPTVTPPQYFDSMQRFCGECWNRLDTLSLWQIDTQWSGMRVDDSFPFETDRDLALLTHYMHDTNLREEEYARLVQRGYLKTAGTPDRMFKTAFQCLWIEGKETNNALIAIGDRIKEKYADTLDALKRPFVKAVLESTPPQLQLMKKFEL